MNKPPTKKAIKEALEIAKQNQEIAKKEEIAAKKLKKENEKANMEAANRQRDELVNKFIAAIPELLKNSRSTDGVVKIVLKGHKDYWNGIHVDDYFGISELISKKCKKLGIPLGVCTETHTEYDVDCGYYEYSHDYLAVKIS